MTTMLKLLAPNSCDECGNSPVFHRLTYVDAVVNDLLSKLSVSDSLLNRVSIRAYSFGESIFPHVFNLLVLAGLAQKQIMFDSETQLLAQMIWKEANARGITIWEFRLFNLPRNLFVAEFPDGKKITFEGIPMPLKAVHRVNWMDNKYILKKEFQQLGFPVARGGATSTQKNALNLFKNLKAPVIVKPRTGSGSRHTTLHITDEKELIRAFDVALQVCPAAIIEEELMGAVYRATVVDGKLAATLRRDPPYVMGDGVHTIQELVNEANKHPARSGPYFSKIKIDDSGMNELKWHGHTPKDILPKGKRVTFHQKVNWSVGGTTADITDEVHPDNVALFERVAEVLKAPIVGIDFIISDISRSWKEQERCGILECNSMPFFDNHHLPFEGKPRNVAGAIWDMIEIAL